MMIRRFVLILVCLGFLTSCSVENEMATNPTQPTNTENPTFKYLALGDSYTIGQSVCAECRFPEQLKTALLANTAYYETDLRIIATTGWTTTNLLNAVFEQNLQPEYDLVTLLIGVNNQYQHKPFSIYENEFPQILNKAITLAKGDKSNVIVLSIPDYAFTPFGQQSSDPAGISFEINTYNMFAQEYCQQNGIRFLNITDITRQGLQNPDLVATDNLHPSALAYEKFVERLLPIAISVLTN